MRKNVMMLTEAAIMIGLAFVLSNIRLFQMPQGGSVTPGSMVPILIFAIRWTKPSGESATGAKTKAKTIAFCVSVGAIEGALQFILGPKWSLHPVSILFDYVFAYGALGLAGIFLTRKASPIITREKASIGWLKRPIKQDLPILLGVLTAILIRFSFHVMSGAIVFYEYAGAQNPWIYSIIYNGTFLSMEALVSLMMILALIRIPLIVNRPSE